MIKREAIKGIFSIVLAAAIFGCNSGQNSIKNDITNKQFCNAEHCRQLPEYG